MQKVRTRIAPSPTGSPHIGTAYAALFNFVFARKNGGDFILRIEDTDRTRFVESSEREIIDALTWLGFEADESPVKKGKFGPYRQSERLDLYQKYAEELVKEERAYYCDCSAERLTKVREDQQAKGEVPRYDRKCRSQPPKSNENCTIRLAVPLEGETRVSDLVRGEIKFENENIDDQVLVKSDGFPTYHLASVVDDHLMEITHVIRAEEWLTSTPKHVILYKAFEWEIPKFAHLPLLRNQDRSKISKRKNPVAIDFYREQGYLSEALVNFLGTMGWSMPEDKEIFTIEEMIDHFEFDRIDPSGPVFNVQKLEWLNGEYIRSMSDEKLAARLQEGFTKVEKSEILRVIPLIKERLKKLSEFDTLTYYFFTDKLEPNLELLDKVSKHSKAETSEMLKDCLQELEKVGGWQKENLEAALQERPGKFAWTKTEYFQTIRVSITSSHQSPPLFDVLEFIGREKVIQRISDTIASLIS